MRLPQVGFLPGFLLLSVFSGATLGMAKIVTTLYALDIGATPAQLGLIAAMESLGMVLLTLPAGFIISRYGSRRVYFLASLGPALLNLAVLLSPAWLWLAATRLLVGVCVPFRVVAMNGMFLQRLSSIGMSRAGWFRGALMLGMGLLGPLLGHWLYLHAGFTLAFVALAACFAIMAVCGLGFWRQPGVAVPAKMDAGMVRRQLRDMFATRLLVSCCLIEWLGSATGSLFATFILVFALDVAGLTQSAAVSLVAVQGAATVLFLFSLGVLARRLSHVQACLLALLTALLAFGLLVEARGFGWLLLAGILLSLATSLVHLANVSRLAAHDMDKSRVAGMFNLFQTLGMLAGALLGGLISQLAGLDRLFACWLPVLLVAALLCMVYGRRADSP